MSRRLALVRTLRHTTMAVACLAALAGGRPALADTPTTVDRNTWIGGISTDWFNPGNWKSGDLFGLPDSSLPVSIGPTQWVVDGVPTNTFDLPAREAVLAGSFSTPSLRLTAWNGLSQLRLASGGALTTSGTIGGLNAAYQASGQGGNAITPATLVLDGGSVAGSLSFTAHSRLEVTRQYGTLNASFLGSLDELVLSNGAALSLPSVYLRIAQIRNAGALSLAGGRNLILAGNVDNTGVFTLNGSSSTGMAHVELDGPTTFSGLGSTVLTDADYSQIGSNGGRTLTIASGHTLRGAGAVNTSVVNQGRVIADGVLTINRYGIGSGFDNSAGLVQVADGGQLVLSWGTLQGGTLQGLGANSRIRSGDGNGTFQDLTLAGQLSVASGSRVHLRGTITNNGTLTLAGSASNGSAAISLDGPTTLAGSGSTVLTDANRSFIGGTSAATLTIASGHTLRGAGFVATPVVNQGQVIADGVLTINGMDSRSSTNSGRLQVNAGAQLKVWSGSGDIVQTGADAVTVVDGQLLVRSLTLQGGRLEGSGTVQADVLNPGGTISAGNSLGTLTVTGKLTLGDDSLLLVEVAGPERGTQYDWLAVGGNVALDGDLQLVFTGYTPHAGDQFTFLTSDGNVSGRFDNAWANGWALDLQYGAQGVTATVTAVPEPASWALMLLGAAGLGVWSRRRQTAGA